MTPYARDPKALWPGLLDGVPDEYPRPERMDFWAEIVLASPATARERLRELLSALVNLPEYQLV